MLTHAAGLQHPLPDSVLKLAQLLVQAGMTGEAEGRLDGFLARYPKNKEAAALKARLVRMAEVTA